MKVTLERWNALWQSLGVAPFCQDFPIPFDLPMDRRDRPSVRNLILATRLHETHLDADASWMVDVDLSILGREESRFWEYERQIRAEYAWVPAEVFAAKRAEVLRRFLKRERLYATPEFSSRFEAQARQNLTASLAQLSSETSRALRVG